jgi:hypothetical protein
MVEQISVVLNAYLARGYVWEALRSVLAQKSARPLDVILLSATEGIAVPAELERMAEERTHSIRVLPAPEGPVGVGVVKAAESARGELVAFLDDDDLWEEGKIPWVESVAGERPSVGYLHHSQTFVDARNRPLSPLSPHRLIRHPSSLMREGRSLVIDPSDPRSLAQAIPFYPDLNNSSCVVRRSILLERAPTLERVRRGEDTFLFYCGVLSGLPMALTSDRLSRYRLHGAAATVARAPVAGPTAYAQRFGDHVEGHIESLGLLAGLIPRGAAPEIQQSVERDLAFWELLGAAAARGGGRSATFRGFRTLLRRPGLPMRSRDAYALLLGIARTASPSITRLAFRSWRAAW